MIHMYVYFDKCVHMCLGHNVIHLMMMMQTRGAMAKAIVSDIAHERTMNK
jgi:hypothetical protein